MLSARTALNQAHRNIEESIGIRPLEVEPPNRSPKPQAQDLGRRPLPRFGMVDVDRVIPDPNQPRVSFSDDGLDRLAQSIRLKGQLSPIRVRWSNMDERWIIIAGERRWQATKRAGLPTIECYFHEDDLSDSEILEQQLIENLLREDLQPIEEAKAFSRLMDINGWNGKQLAEALHVAPAKVSRSLALLKLPAEVQSRIAGGELSSRAAYELSKVSDETSCRKLAATAASQNWTHDQAAKAVRRRNGKRRRRANSQLNQTFATETGWKIVASHPGKSTYHELRTSIVEVLEEIDARIAGRVEFY